MFSHLRHVGRHDAVAALGHHRNLGSAPVRRHAEPEKADAERPRDFLHLREMRHEFRAGLMHCLDRRARKFELAARLEGDRAATGYVEQADDVAVLDNRFPTEQMLHAFEQRTDAALTLIRDRFVAVDRKHEFLVLGTEAKPRSGLAARFKPRDEFLARFDRRHVDLVASHTAVPTEKGRDLTRGLQGRAIAVTPRNTRVLRPKISIGRGWRRCKIVELAGFRLPRADLQTGRRRRPPFLPCRSAALRGQNARRTSSPAVCRVRTPATSPYIESSSMTLRSMTCGLPGAPQVI